MIVCNFVVVALIAQALSRTVDVAWPETGPLPVACPVGQATSIVFPEPLRRLKTFGPDREAIAVTVERATPTAVVVIRPRRHPAQCGLEFHGTTLTLRLDLRTTAAGDAQELRLTAPTPAASDPTVAAPSLDSSPPAKEPDATPTPSSADVPHGEPASQQALWARAVPIGRREGLPGQPVLLLEDALETGEWIWYRMRLEGGAREQIAALEWERGPLSDYQQVSDGADRRILVRVPRRLVSRRTRLVLKLESGAIYRVPPFPPTLSGFFGRLFH